MQSSDISWRRLKNPIPEDKAIEAINKVWDMASYNPSVRLSAKIVRDVFPILLREIKEAENDPEAIAAIGAALGQLGFLTAICYPQVADMIGDMIGGAAQELCHDLSKQFADMGRKA